MGGEAKAVAANLEQHRRASLVDREHPRIGRQQRAIAHVERIRIGWRQMPRQGVGIGPARLADAETQRRGGAAAAGSDGEHDAAQADADHRQTRVEECRRQPQLGGQAWQKIAARHALRTRTQQDQAIMALRRSRQAAARHVRARVDEADGTALEMVFQETEVFAIRMLHHAKRDHVLLPIRSLP
jgi:hypothetical protein